MFSEWHSSEPMLLTKNYFQVVKNHDADHPSGLNYFSIRHHEFIISFAVDNTTTSHSQVGSPCSYSHSSLPATVRCEGILPVEEGRHGCFCKL